MFDYTDGTQNDLDKAQKFADLKDGIPIKVLRSKYLTANETPLSFRTINSWTSAGLLDDSRSKPGQGWRKFSTVDITLMSILVELRKFGLSLETLKKVKNSLYLPAQKSDNPNIITRLEFALIRSKNSVGDGNTYLLIDSDGNTGVLAERDLVLNRFENKLPDTYIYLNLNKVLKSTFKTMDVWEEYTLSLYRSEWDLINSIRLTDGTKDITVKADKNRIKMIEKSFSGKPQDVTNLHNLINEIGYGQVQLTIKDGKVCHLQGKTQDKR